MTSTLKALAHTILSGVEAIEAAYSKAGVSLPSLDDPFVPSPLDGDAAVMDAQRLVAGAAAQIIANARQPMESLQEYVMGTYMTASLGFVVEVNIPDILKDAGSQVSSNSCYLSTRCLCGRSRSLMIRDSTLKISQQRLALTQ